MGFKDLGFSDSGFRIVVIRSGLAFACGSFLLATSCLLETRERHR